MKEEILQFIKNNELSPFNQFKTPIKSSHSSIFKTRDSKQIHNRVLSNISSSFVFKETQNLWNSFPFTSDFSEIQKRQEFFKSFQLQNYNSLKFLKKPRAFWKPKYSVIIVTENEKTLSLVNKMGCTARFITSQNDALDLDKYDIVQVVDCEESQRLMEQLPQSVFLDSLDDVYLERYLELLSGWKENLIILKNSINPEIKEIVSKLSPLLELLDSEVSIISLEKAEETLKIINSKISEKIKEMTISGDSLLKIVGQGILPDELNDIVRNSIKESEIPQQVFNIRVPVTIDESSLDELIKKQSSNQFTRIAEKVKFNSSKLREIPKLLAKLSNLLILEDFTSGLSNFLSKNRSYPQISQEFSLTNSSNLFLEQAQPISFFLNQENKCSILTGANSGGKTTLLEHILQLISLTQLGLPTSGQFQVPLFSEVYYFAKNKGSMSKGAFETLLTQMSKIKPGKQTLILADEIEAVTEPGIAGKIICATCDFFIKKDCFLIFATHLGYEIQKNLPQKSRIDGIEARGLDENFNLLVNHNPVLGRLARSTPELIVKRMASSQDTEYFSHLQNSLESY